jgi:hypothetical protein
LAEVAIIRNKKLKGQKRGFGFIPKHVLIKAGQSVASRQAGKSHYSMQRKNELGLCEAQMEARLQIACDIVKRSPTEKELKEVDNRLYYALREKYGSLNKAKEHYKLKINIGPTGEHLSDTEMIADLRDYVLVNKEIPKNKADRPIEGLRRGPKAYRIHFGSWRRAKMIAGLDQLLEEVKST